MSSKLGSGGTRLWNGTSYSSAFPAVCEGMERKEGRGEEEEGGGGRKGERGERRRRGEEEEGGGGRKGERGEEEEGEEGGRGKRGGGGGGWMEEGERRWERGKGE